MINLKTNYLGLELKNPIIVGSCNLTQDVNILKKLEEAGAAAIVYKSLFEEQIQLENLMLSEIKTEFYERHAEMIRIFPDIDHAGPAEYLFQLEKIKKEVNIPVFASLNAINKETWIEYAKKIESTGVEGIELNFYSIPTIEGQSDNIIDEQIDITKEVVNTLKIPVAVKLTYFYTNLAEVIKKFDSTGVKAIVMFNRLFQPDIDIETETHHFPYNLSVPEDNRLPLRFVGLTYGEIKANICANTGIFDHTDVIKMLLAGADAVQIVSTLYKNKPEIITKILNGLTEWMKNKDYHSINDFKGKLSAKYTSDIFAYKRAQYVDILMKSNQIFKKYPTV